MERTLSINRYIAAFVITLIIFFLGFVIGVFVDKIRADYTTSVIEQQKIESDSLQLQYFYLTAQNITENCPALRTIFNTNLNSLENAFSRLSNYKNRAVYKKDKFSLNYRQYALEEIKYWTLSDKIKASCKEDIVRILFFFTLDCDECVTQGFVLDYFKKLLGDKLLVFSFNSKLAEEEPLINTLIAQFNITKYPSLVIEDQRIEEFNDRDTLNRQICSHYINKPDICLN